MRSGWRGFGVAVVVGGLLLAGCGDDDDSADSNRDDQQDNQEEHDQQGVQWPGETDETTRHETGDGPVVELPDGWEVETFDNAEMREDPERPGCSHRAARLSDGEVWIDVESNSSDCAGIAQDDIGNGYHGIYVTLDEVPAPQDVEEHQVSSGTLTTFVQEYYECTNSCSTYEDHVGILTFDDPPGRDRRTLVLLDAKGQVPIERLVALADAISPR